MLRFWAYLASAIIATGLVSFLTWQRANSALQVQTIEQEAASGQRLALEQYLEQQTDGRKLISLAKKMEHSRPELIEPVALKAYELLPGSPDAILLAARFVPAIAERIKEVDPLYTP